MTRTERPTQGAGYSAKPLATKLGIRAGSRVKTLRAPEQYERLLAPLPTGALVSARLRNDIDVWHVFASGVATDVTEDAIREVALPMGLVDVKVCAVEETWSGLKLVIRKSSRGA